MKKPSKKKTKPFFEMTHAERDKYVAQFDRPIDLEKVGRPLTKKERTKFESMIAGKPRVSVRDPGLREVVVNLDDDLLSEASQYAKRHRTTLPKMIDRGLRGLLSFGG